MEKNDNINIRFNVDMFYESVNFILHFFYLIGTISLP